MALTKHNQAKMKSVIGAALRVTANYINYQQFSFTKRRMTAATTRHDVLLVAKEFEGLALFLANHKEQGWEAAKRMLEILREFASHADVLRSSIFGRRKLLEEKLVPLEKELAHLAESVFGVTRYDENSHRFDHDESQQAYVFPD